MAFRSGYLTNCTAFLDLNQNELLDSGETFASTGANGAYTITLPQVCLVHYPQSLFIPLFRFQLSLETLDRMNHSPCARMNINATCPSRLSRPLRVPARADAIGGRHLSSTLSL